MEYMLNPKMNASANWVEKEDYNKVFALKKYFRCHSRGDHQLTFLHGIQLALHRGVWL